MQTLANAQCCVLSNWIVDVVKKALYEDDRESAQQRQEIASFLLPQATKGATKAVNEQMTNWSAFDLP